MDMQESAAGFITDYWETAEVFKQDRNAVQSHSILLAQQSFIK